MGIISQCIHGTMVSQCRCMQQHGSIQTVPCPPKCPKNGDPADVVYKVEYATYGVIVSESSKMEIDAPSVELAKLKASQWAYAFRFVHEPKPIPGYVAKPLKTGSWYFLGGEVFSLAEAVLEFGADSAVVWNLEHNRYDRCVRTRFGQVMPLDSEDVVL